MASNPIFLSPNTQFELIREAQNSPWPASERAFRKLICAYSPFIKSQVKYYTQKCTSLPLNNIQCAIENGFVKAILKFDLSRDTGVVAYAIYQIKNEIKRELYIEKGFPNTFLVIDELHGDLYCEEKTTEIASKINQISQERFQDDMMQLEELMDSEITSRSIENFVKDLPERQRKFYKLRVEEDMPVSEAADKMGISRVRGYQLINAIAERAQSLINKFNN